MEEVISVDVLAGQAESFYITHNTKVENDVLDWLDARDGMLRDACVKWLNAALVSVVKTSVNRAVRARELTVTAELRLAKIAQKLIANQDPAIRSLLDQNKLEFAMVLLAEEAGYAVNNKAIRFTLEIGPNEVEEPEEPEAPRAPIAIADPGEQSFEEAPQEEVAAETSLEIVNPVLVEPNLEEVEEEEEEEEEPPAPPVNLGHHYSNSKGIIRRADTFADGKVGYTIIESSNARYPVGSQGDCSVKSFLSWAKEDIGIPEAA